MFSNYLRIALRSLRKHKIYSAISILGLAVGLATCLLMMLYVQDEMTFDMFHSRADQTCRLVTTVHSANGDQRLPFVMGPAGPELLASTPEVTASVRIRDRSGTGRFTVGYGDRRFYEGDYLIAEQSFFEVFDFPLAQGDPRTALAEPFTVVLTESAARKYFGHEDPLGKALFVERLGDLKVTGILQDPPHNSHLQFSMVFSFATLTTRPGWVKFAGSWQSDGFLTYVTLREEADRPAVQARLDSLYAAQQKAMRPEVARLTLQPLGEIHFGSGDMEFDRNSFRGDPASAAMFASAALLILLIACINYTNFSTAHAAMRTREIGMRRVVGAGHGQLIAQLLGESLLTAILALLAALALVEFSLPAFNELAGKSITLAAAGTLPVVLGTVGLTLAVGLLSGLYPALHFGRLSSVRLLKSRAATGRQSLLLRRGLVVLQFAISFIMLVATLVAHQQLSFIRATNLGFDRDQLLVVDINSGETRKSFEAIKAEISRLPGIRSVSVSSRVPGDWKSIARIDVAAPSGAGLEPMSFICVDQDFLNTFGIRLLAGRNISADPGGDTAAVMLNATAARRLGWTDPINREIAVPESNFKARVVGLVEDFHFRSLHEPIGPVVLGHRMNPIEAIDYFTIRLQTSDYAGTIAALEQIHRQFDKVTPLEYNFLDRRIDDFYRDDQRAGRIFTIAAVLAIGIACLGLLGLVSFVTGQRTKEIGIRKVLGASVPGLVALLSREFLGLVALAVLIAAPLSWFLMQRWLENFAYRVSFGPGTLAVAAVLALGIALVTVSVQAVRTALGNPVESLRYE